MDELLTSRDWIPGISAELHIARQEDAFVVTSGDANAKYTYALEDLILVTRKIQPSDELLRKNDDKLFKCAWSAAERASGLTLDPKVPGSSPGPAVKNDGLMQRVWWNAGLAN